MRLSASKIAKQKIRIDGLIRSEFIRVETFASCTVSTRAMF